MTIAYIRDKHPGDETQIVASPFERVPASSQEAGAFSIALQ